jgi:hypothetical protein
MVILKQGKTRMSVPVRYHEHSMSSATYYQMVQQVWWSVLSENQQQAQVQQVCYSF